MFRQVSRTSLFLAQTRVQRHAVLFIQSRTERAHETYWKDKRDQKQAGVLWMACWWIYHFMRVCCCDWWLGYRLSIEEKRKVMDAENDHKIQKLLCNVRNDDLQLKQWCHSQLMDFFMLLRITHYCTSASKYSAFSPLITSNLTDSGLFFPHFLLVIHGSIRVSWIDLKTTEPLWCFHMEDIFPCSIIYFYWLLSAVQLV